MRAILVGLILSGLAVDGCTGTVTSTCEGEDAIPPLDQLVHVQKLVAEGNAHAEAQLADAYLWGKGVPQNENEALLLLNSSAKHGDSEGQFLLAIYHASLKTHGDLQKAAYWLFYSAKNGCIPAELNIGILMSRGLIVGKSKEDGLKIIEKIANEGNPEAQLWLGTMLLSGKDTAKDVAKGFYWTKLASDKNYQPARFTLAGLYIQGLGAVADPENGVNLLKSIVDNKNTLSIGAAYSLGVFYMDGKYIKKNTTEAIHWMALASKEKFGDSEERLRKLLQNIPQWQVVTDCPVYLDEGLTKPDEASNALKKNDSVYMLGSEPSSQMVFIPTQSSVRYISRQCTLFQ